MAFFTQLKPGMSKKGTYNEVKRYMSGFNEYSGMGFDSNGTLCLLTCYDTGRQNKYSDKCIFKDQVLEKVVYYESVKKPLCNEMNKRLYEDSISKRSVLYGHYFKKNLFGECRFTPYGEFVVTEDVDYNTTKDKRAPRRYILETNKNQ